MKNKYLKFSVVMYHPELGEMETLTTPQNIKIKGAKVIRLRIFEKEKKGEEICIKEINLDEEV